MTERHSEIPPEALGESESTAGDVQKAQTLNSWEVELPSLAELQEFKAKYLDKSIERNQIDVDEFDHVYSADEIERDKQKLDDRKAAFSISKSVETDPQKIENKKKLEVIARMFEVMCADHSVLSRAFNVPKGEVVAQMASEFDDIMRKSDLFIEFPNKKTEHSQPKDYAIGVDVTISRGRYRDKVREQKTFFDDNNHIPEVKYFRESRYKQKGEAYEGKAALPKFIINASPKDLLPLMDAWKRWEDGKHKLVDEKEKQRFLRVLKVIDNPIWLRLVYQMRRQANDLEEYFKRNRDTARAGMYANAKTTLGEAQAKILWGFIQRDRSLAEKIDDITREKNPESRKLRLQKVYQDKLADLLDDNTKAAASMFSKEFKRR